VLLIRKKGEKRDVRRKVERVAQTKRSPTNRFGNVSYIRTSMELLVDFNILTVDCLVGRFCSSLSPFQSNT
jgi:hypothetical protein